MALNETLRALADPVRRRILVLLRKKSMTSGEIAAQFDISQAAISRHLTVLKKAGLIRSHHDGPFIINELNASILDETILWLRELKGEAYETQTDQNSVSQHS